MRLGSGHGWRRHLLLAFGGVLGIAAQPTARRVRRVLMDRAVRPSVGADPVAPFREAPCYGRDRDDAAAPVHTTRATR